MKSKCLDCNRELKNYEGKRRFLNPQYQERFNINHSVLYYFHCRGRDGCGAEYIHQVNVPVDGKLANYHVRHRDFGLFRQAMFIRPGVERIGSNASQHTKLAKKDPASVFQFVIENAEKLATLPHVSQKKRWDYATA